MLIDPESATTAPPLVGTGWLNSPPLTLRSLAGRVVVLVFWDYTHVSSVQMLPYWGALHQRYAPFGLTVIGIHVARYDFGRQIHRVAQAIRQLNILFPVLVDAQMATWEAYGKTSWITHFVIDARGRIRGRFGRQGDFRIVEKAVRALIVEKDPTANLPAMVQGLRPEDEPDALLFRATPSVEAGYEHRQLGNPEGFTPERVNIFRDPGEYREGLLYLDGAWRCQHNHVELVTGDGTVTVLYRARDVYLVARSAFGEAVPLHIRQDDQPLAPDHHGADVRSDFGDVSVSVDAPRLYHIVGNPLFGRHKLALYSPRAGIVVYSLSFGTSVVPSQVREVLEARGLLEDDRIVTTARRAGEEQGNDAENDQ